MKKFFSILFVVILTISLFAGCGSNKETEPTDTNDTNTQTEQPDKETSDSEESNDEAKYVDGIYFAAEKDFNEKSGWKYVVTLEVKDGKIASADWNAAHKNGGKDKKTVSADGDYGLVEKGGAQAEWHEQAAKAEAFLLETQDPTAINYTSDEGNTDDIAGVSIKVAGFFKLAKEALDNGPVGTGNWQDGTFHAEEPEFNEQNGWKSTVDVTVINGFIVAANWNGIHKDGGDDKKTLSANGGYGLVEKGGAQAEWHEQAASAEAFLLEKQDPTAISYSNDAGNTDDIAGVSIHVAEFFKLAEEALQAR